jgi:hypothetical protein
MLQAVEPGRRYYWAGAERNTAVEIRELRTIIFPVEEYYRRRNERVQDIISRYGFDELCNCLPIMQLPTGEDTMPKLSRPILNAELLRIANTPIVRVLLYDLDLLPEPLIAQEEMTIELCAAYNRLVGVLLAFKFMEMQKRTP